MTFADCKPEGISVDLPCILSDHSLVVCLLPVAVDPAPSIERLVRAWRQVDCDNLRRVLEDIVLCQPVPDDANVDELFSTYDSVLRDIADRFAPSHAIRRRADRRAPWFNTECIQHAASVAAVNGATDGLAASSTDRRQWVDATRRRFQLYRSKKEAYWTSRVVQDGRFPAHLWRSLSAILDKYRDVTGATGHSAEVLPPSSAARSTTSGPTLQPLRLQSSRTQRRLPCRHSGQSLSAMCVALSCRHQ